MKPENVLIDKNGNMCLTDFGISKKLSNEYDRTSTVLGTAEYMPPEVYQNG